MANKYPVPKKTKESVLLLFITVCVSITFTVFTSGILFFRNNAGLAKTSATPAQDPQLMANTHRLVIYNKPPKTGSTSVRFAMSLAMERVGKKSAPCFSMTEWNNMAFNTLINMHNVDFWGCHVQLDDVRYPALRSQRGGNVIFMTSTRPPKRIILSAYLQENRKRHDDLMKMTTPDVVAAEVQAFKRFVENYPVDALYKFHGADVSLNACPIRWPHIAAMRAVSARYQVVVDLNRPKESEIIVEELIGVKPDFSLVSNERTGNSSHPLIAALLNVDTTHKNCGNQLVHDTLKMQYNIIKDRLMQNGCFDEGAATVPETYRKCEHEELTRKSIVRKLPSLLQ